MLILLTLALSLDVPRVPHVWRSVPVVAGGFVTGVIPHPRSKDVVYCRTDIGGAYRLDPKTRRWQPLQDWIKRSDWNYYGVESVALDPTDPNRVYLAVGTYTNDWAGNGAILRSADQGRTWKTTTLPFKNGGNEEGRSIGERLAVDPKNPRVLYFGTRHEGLWRSLNQGASWSPVRSFPIKNGSGGVGLGWVIFGQKGEIYVGPAIPGVPIYRSPDDGVTWEPVADAPAMIPHHAEIGADGTLYVTYGNRPGPNGVTDGAVWKRDPKGAWTEITPLKPSAAEPFGYAGLSLDRKNPGTLIVSTLDRWGKDTIFRSRDGGKSWVSLADRSSRDVSASPYLAWDRDEADFGHWIGDCEIDPFNPERVWYVTGATIYETTEVSKADRGQPTRWFVGGVGIEETAVIDLASPPFGPHVVSALGDIGGFVHVDLDRPAAAGMMLRPLLSSTDSIEFAALRPQYFVRTGRRYGEGRHGGYSLDGGETWAELATDPPGGASGGPSAISADGSAVVWSRHVSRDWGKTWLPCEGLPEGVRPAADPTDANVFFAWSAKGGALFRSSDGGKKFSPVGDLPPGEGVKLELVFGQPGHLWVATSVGLFRSTDAGRTVQKVDGIAEARSASFGMAAKTGGYPTVFVIGRIGETQGVFRSTDEGKSWIQVNDEATGLGTMEVVCGDPKVFGRVYIGTNGRGIHVAEPRRR